LTEKELGTYTFDMYAERYAAWSQECQATVSYTDMVEKMLPKMLFMNNASWSIYNFTWALVVFQGFELLMLHMNNIEVIDDKVLKIILYTRRGLGVVFIVVCMILIGELYRNSGNEQLVFLGHRTGEG
jgi:hypothetical protein